jgi:catechol 2,3-dioxygenase-like lactoylglutathione lyase family enzyme
VRERVTGIGGVFFKAKDRPALAEWYRRRLGIDVQEPGWALFHWRESDTERPAVTVWSVFPDSTDYFGAPAQRAMINYRVRDLDALLEQLRSDGVAIDETRHEDENGRFAWITDPEGNRIELWQPVPGR